MKTSLQPLQPPSYTNVTCEICSTPLPPRPSMPVCELCAHALRWRTVIWARRRKAVARKLAELDGRPLTREMNTHV